MRNVAIVRTRDDSLTVEFTSRDWKVLFGPHVPCGLRLLELLGFLSEEDISVGRLSLLEAASDVLETLKGDRDLLQYDYQYNIERYAAWSARSSARCSASPLRTSSSPGPSSDAWGRGSGIFLQQGGARRSTTTGKRSHRPTEELGFALSFLKTHERLQDAQRSTFASLRRVAEDGLGSEVGPVPSEGLPHACRQ